MGYSVLGDQYDFVISAYKDAQQRQRAMEAAEQADVVIIGSAPDSYIRSRLKNNKLTFRYAERIFKKGQTDFGRQVKHTLKNRPYRNKNLYYMLSSAYAAEDFIRCGARAEKLYQWGYFPETKVYDTQQLIAQKEPATLLWTARMLDLKHPEAAVRVARRLKQDGYDFRLDMIGNGELEETVRQLIDRYDLSDRVHLLGAMPPEQVREQMETHSIFLFTSDQNEGWGAVVNEAMNSGCAVIADSRIGSVPFLIRDGQNGLVYENGNEEALYAHVKSLLDDRDKCREIGKNAVDTILSVWNAEAAAKRFVNLCDRFCPGQKQIPAEDAGVLSRAVSLDKDRKKGKNETKESPRENGRLVFVGLLYAPEDAQRVLQKSKIGLQAAANNYQWGMIRGLHGASGQALEILNTIPMGTFPKYSKILFEKTHREDLEQGTVQNFGYCNLPLIKQWQRTGAIYRNLRRILKNSDRPVTVLVYSLYHPYLKALARLKKKHPDFRYILIVPDLPGVFGAESRNPVRKHLGRIMGKSSLQMSRLADGYVLLTEQMAGPLEIGDKPFTVVEGICNNEVTIPSDYRRQSPPTVLYTGALDRAFGLDVLVEAFQKLPAGSAKLQLAGSGEYLETIQLLCAENPNISYLGYLPKEQIHALQRSASVLVNPRSAEEAYTQYSFPSKTMEYLSTGVPVVMNKLPGIPAEYHCHLFLTQSSTADSLAQTLQAVLQMDEQALLEHGIRAAKFVETEKSSIPQGKKVMQLSKKLSAKP